MKEETAPIQTAGETCPICDGSGMSDPMLPATDPANEPCSACGGDGVLPVFDEAAFERAKDESRYGR